MPLSSGVRRTHILQRAAGKMFYQWGEIIGMRLEEMIASEKLNYEQIDATLGEPEKQNELIQQDEEEDFLDEASVNPDGNGCPAALKLIACLILYEITAFLRETYQTLPKTSKLSTKEKPAPWEKVYREANRRWSMALSSMGHSQTSAQSLQSIAGGDNERKISFVLHEPDNESENSSNTTVTMQGEENTTPTTISSSKYLCRSVSAITKFQFSISIFYSFSIATKTSHGQCSSISAATRHNDSSNWWLIQTKVIEIETWDERGKRN